MTIRKIIKQGQALMCDLEVQRLVNIVHDLDKQLDEDGRRIAFLTGAARDYCWPSCHQSLGELCIEIAVDEWRHMHVLFKFPYTDSSGTYPCNCRELSRTILDPIRIAMYHKEKT